MTDPYATESLADDIDDTSDLTSERLSRQADDILAQDRTTSLRQAVRDDLGQGREWARARAERARVAIHDDPIRSTAYALGIGVLIGLLLRR